MTVFAMRDRGSLMAVRFAISPAWKTQVALQSLTDERGPTYHRPWTTRVQSTAGSRRAAQPSRGRKPDELGAEGSGHRGWGDTGEGIGERPPHGDGRLANDVEEVNQYAAPM